MCSAVRFVSVEDDGLKGCDFDRFSAARIETTQLVVKADTIVFELGEPGAVPLIRPGRQRSLFGPAAPFYRVFQRSAALGAVELRGDGLILFDKKVPFFHWNPSLAGVLGPQGRQTLPCANNPAGQGAYYSEKGRAANKHIVKYRPYGTLEAAVWNRFEPEREADQTRHEAGDATAR